MAMFEREKLIATIGWIAAFLAFLVFVSFIDQIRLNLAGQKGSVILPVITIFNCTAWVLYGSLKPKVDWPIVAPNAVGIILGAATAITTLF